MKVRNGFVSNSSSSSFIVALPKSPDSVEELRDILFKDVRTLDYYSKSFSTMEVAQQVYKDICRFVEDNKDKSTDRIIFDIVTDDFYDEENWQHCYDKAGGDYSKFDNELYKTLNLPLMQGEINGYKQTLDIVNNKFVFTVEYSDNDGNFYCVLEHGGTFDRVKHIKISRH